MLLEIAGKIGLNKTEFITYLNSFEAEKRVNDSSRKAIDSGITGVPTFIIEYEAVVGTQATDTLRMIILRHRKRTGIQVTMFKEDDFYIGVHTDDKCKLPEELREYEELVEKYEKTGDVSYLKQFIDAPVE